MTAAEFTARFNQFKQTQPEWQAGKFTADKIAEWQETFFQKVLADVRREAFDVAWNEVHRLGHGFKSESRMVTLDKVESVILAARDKIK